MKEYSKDISPRLQKEIDKIAAVTFGRTVSESVKSKICVQCTKSVYDDETKQYLFRDDMGKKEYVYSGFCQRCQDPVFGLGDYGDTRDSM
jgi:hypothetical protein